jgi:hypothetical protein
MKAPNLVRQIAAVAALVVVVFAAMGRGMDDCHGDSCDGGPEIVCKCVCHETVAVLANCVIVGPVAVISRVADGERAHDFQTPSDIFRPPPSA